MARFMLDGRTPLNYDEALKRFELLHFGEMSDGCRSAMLELVREGEGFRRYYDYTLEFARGIADLLIKSDALDQ